jgi:hypothetical protein
MVLKLGIYAYFLWCYLDTKRTLKRRSERYFYIFLLSASAYLLTIPFVVVGTLMYAPYERQYVFVLLSSLLMQSCSSVLCYQLTSKNSSYNKEGNLESAGVLPMSFGGPLSFGQTKNE